MEAHCAICNTSLDEFFCNYPNPVCRTCEQRAVNTCGDEPSHDSINDQGDNPVFIDGRKCWRRYRFGGYITMLDVDDCVDLDEFHNKHTN